MTTRHSGYRITVLALGLSVGVFLGLGLATAQDAVPAVLSADDIVNVAVDGVSPGRAMPIPYTAACGTCHVVSELPFK